MKTASGVPQFQAENDSAAHETTGAGLKAKRLKSLPALCLATVCALATIVCLAVPMYVIRPFRAQDPRALSVALTVRDLGPWISAVCALVALAVLIRAWRRKAGLFARIGLILLTSIAIAGACLTHVNIFEIMFHPYPSPQFGDAASAHVDGTDKVVAVTIGGVSRAYPILTLGYHHIVNDDIGDTAFAVTYCTLCHTGLVWNRMLDGRMLRFRLAGINNGNALMRDEETSSIWQQSTGQCIYGPLKGRQLSLIHSDEVTFALWRKEQPLGVVLQPEAKYVSKYDDKDWEKEVEKTRTVVDTRQSGISPHELMLGMTVDGHSKAYPVKTVMTAKLIEDRIADTSILIVVGPDGASIRAFRASLSAEPMTFLLAQSDAQPGKDGILRDAETGSLWNFQGCAVDGKLAGRCLEPLDTYKDYWFDWMNHHPASLVFKG